MQQFEYVFPAIRGVQAGREYFVTMCPLKLLPKLFPPTAAELRPELQIQRAINRKRVPEIARYLSAHRDSYVLPAFTAAVDTKARFEPTRDDQSRAMGTLRVPIAARFLLLDGLHRCAAIEAALKKQPKLGDETASVVLFVDPGFRRVEQAFTDLKRHERKSARSLSILHDDRDETARLCRELVERVPVFRDTTEMVRTSISNRSLKLFTFSAIYQATKLLLGADAKQPYNERLKLATAYWTEVARFIPDWQRAARGEINPAQLRSQYVHCHTIALVALGRAGRALLDKYPNSWQRRLARLKTFDWSRSNSGLWEGRAMLAGRLSKSRTSLVLTANAIKQHLGLPLTSEESEIELRRARNT